MAHTVECELGFLSRHTIYDTEKPYSCRFNPEDFPRHNLHTETKKVVICDARQLGPTVEENGFALTCIPTKMHRDDFYDHEKIESVYAPELQAHLKTLFQARHVRVIDYAVRRFFGCGTAVDGNILPKSDQTSGTSAPPRLPYIDRRAVHESTACYAGTPRSASNLHGQSTLRAELVLDFAHREGEKMLRTLYGDRAEEVLQHRWQIIK